ncbi:hypothetical protein AQUCO_04900051v1 [Aquilegia coerulea]|uniref:Ribosomal protein L23/L25 N-terminal domain-containing protein n=1 Tax=Aquilegia coerulea TaxID=218851 RepID=A0A2G5CKX0_AQUCA|nr:hypothetical protein AQUCO_04900051v1 [Aquilegia coerulea]
MELGLKLANPGFCQIWENKMRVKKKIGTYTVTFQQRGNPKYPRSISTTAPSTRHKLEYYQILKYPLTTESAIKEIQDNNTLVFIVDIHADKKNIRDAVKMLYDIQIKKVNTLTRPGGRTKKAFVSLAPDYNALDVVNKFGKIF